MEGTKLGSEDSTRSKVLRARVGSRTCWVRDREIQKSQKDLEEGGRWEA